MEEIGIPKLTPEQVEELCEIAEKAARKYVLSKIPMRQISVLDITVDIEGTKPITVNIDTEVNLLPEMKGYNVRRLADGATQRAFVSLERHLRKIACKSAE